MTRSMRVIPVILLAGMVGTLVLPSLAQSDRASMVGVTKDASGALIPNAKVKITHVATGQTFETESNEEGRYVTPSILRSGTYKVEASKEGFKTAVIGQVVLNIGDVREVNIALELGAITQQVTITAEAQQLETETSNRGEVITGRQITELPLKDRNFTQLATLAPGVSRATIGILTDATAFNQGDNRIGMGDVPGGSNSQGSTEASRFSRSGGASISVNGLRPTTNNFTLDGVDNNEPQFGSIGVFPNPDAIAEFKVDTSVAKAEVGRGGATINTTYQSGTNDFHGSTYYYGQNDALNATHSIIQDFRAREIASGATPAKALADNPKSRIRIHEFGGTFGGPIIKKKTFFFVDYLGQRNATPNPFADAVPTAKSRIGDLSEFTAPVLDPQTCNTKGDLKSGGCTAFPGNIIPNLQGRPDFNPQAFKLLALYPLPTVSTINPRNGSNQNFFGIRNNTEVIDSFDIKADHRFSQNNTITGRFTRDNQERVRANFFPKVPTTGFGAGEESGNTRQVVVSDTHTFRPTILNELRFGWTRVEIGIFNCGVGGACGVSPTACQDLGIPNCNKGTLATSGGVGTGGFGTGEFEFSGDGGLLLVKSNNYYVNDSLTVISGKHAVKMGIEARPRFLDTIDGGRAGFLKGNIGFAACPDHCSNQSTGNIQADYLLSRPATTASSGSILGGDNPFQLRNIEWAAFFQDDFKVTPSLTLNLGVRWDIFPTMTERGGRIANFDLSNSAIILGNKTKLVNADKDDFGPRVGFAWNFGPKKAFVLRGGYGIFYATDGLDRPPLVGNPPLTRSVGIPFDSASPTGFNLATGPPDSTPIVPPVIDTGTQYFVVPFRQSTPFIQEYNLGVQWQFSRDWLLDIGYAGTNSNHLLATRELGNNGDGLGQATTPTGALINSAIAYENRSNANYSALQVRVDRRYSFGVQFTANYTYSHNIDDSTGVFNGYGESRGTSGGPVNPLNFRADRSNSSLDRRHLFNTNVIWDLPFGKGKAVWSGVSESWNKVIGGWQTNFIFSAAGGQPFGVLSDSSIGRTRADQLCGDPKSGAPAGKYLNISCFVSPAKTATNLAGKVIPVGNSSRNAFTGPSFFRTDLSIFKNSNFGERYRVQFGFEFFNAFNVVDHVVPNTCICDSGAFGRFDTALPPRQIQYRLKVFF